MQYPVGGSKELCLCSVCETTQLYKLYCSFGLEKGLCAEYHLCAKQAAKTLFVGYF